MSGKGDIWTEVLNRLRGNPTLSAYVKKIYDFNRDVVVSGEMPCIIIHPKEAEEVYADFPKHKQDFLRAEIRGILYIKDRLEYEKTIMLEDGDFVGLYKFEADIKNALENVVAGTSDDLSFNLKGHYPKFGTTEYKNLDNVSAHVVIEIEIDGRYFFVGTR